MKIRDGLDESQAEAAPGCRSALFHAIEPVQDLFPVSGGDAGTGIGDAQCRSSGNFIQREHDVGSSRAVSNSVFDKVGKELRE